MKKSPTEYINLGFSIIMILITTIGSFLFLFTDFYDYKIFGSKRYVLAFVFLAYAIFRSYRVYNVFKTEQKIL